MSLTCCCSSFFRIRPILLSTLIIAATAQTACAQSKPAGQDAGKAGEPRVGISTERVVVVTADGKTADDTMVTLNPCKGETPGDVLGVSEQLETPRRVAAFIAKLRDPDPKTRACAARHLGYLGADAREALPHIIKRMREDEHDGVGVNLSEALWAIGPDTRATVEEWLESISAKDAEVRFYSAFALGYYRPHPARQRAVIDALAKATRDEDGGVRWMAVRGLMRLGRAAGAAGDAGEAIPALLLILRDEKNALRHLAALALGNFGPAAEDAAPELLRVFYAAQDFNLYTSARIGLGNIGPAIVPLLEKDLQTDKTLRVLDVLEQLAPHGAPLVIKALGMKDAKVRQQASDIIWKFGPAAAPAVPLLVKELKEGNKDSKDKAVVALNHLGPVAKAAAPALMAALGVEDDFVKCYAAKALGEVGAADAVPQLRRLMSLPMVGEKDTPQRCAAEALMKMGPETKALVPPEMVKRVEEFYRMIEGSGRGYEVDETKPKPKEKKKEAPPPGL